MCLRALYKCFLSSGKLTSQQFEGIPLCPTTCQKSLSSSLKVLQGLPA